MSEEKEVKNKNLNSLNGNLDGSVHDVCHSLNDGMPQSSGLVSKFEETIERFAEVDAKEFLDEIIKIADDK